MIDNKYRAYIRAYNGRGFGSGFIKRFTFGEYSHNSIVIIEPNIQVEIEAIQGKGVIYHAPKPSGNKHSFDMYKIPLDKQQVIDLRLILMEQVGSSYDWGGIWGFMIRRDKHSMYKWFCSELAAWACLKVGHPLSRREPYRETPTSTVESLQVESPHMDTRGSA